MAKFDNVKKVLVEEMYESCWDCPFAFTINEHSGGCNITGHALYLMEESGRPDSCPLMLKDEMQNWFFFTQPATQQIKNAVFGLHNS